MTRNLFSCPARRGHENSGRGNRVNIRTNKVPVALRSGRDFFCTGNHARGENSTFFVSSAWQERLVRPLLISLSLFVSSAAEKTFFRVNARSRCPKMRDICRSKRSRRRHDLPPPRGNAIQKHSINALKRKQ